MKSMVWDEQSLVLHFIRARFAPICYSVCVQKVSIITYFEKGFDCATIG
jgi:hypothetical protein